jgi:hypothetical protein
MNTRSFSGDKVVPFEKSYTVCNRINTCSELRDLSKKKPTQESEQFNVARLFELSPNSNDGQRNKSRGILTSMTL